MEVYEAFGDCWTMLELTESLLNELAVASAETVEAGEDEVGGDADGPVLPFDGIPVDWSRPSASRTRFFERATGIDLRDEEAVRTGEVACIEDAASWTTGCSSTRSNARRIHRPARPTFVTGYPSAVSPLTRPVPDDPDFGMPSAGLHGPAYTGSTTRTSSDDGSPNSSPSPTTSEASASTRTSSTPSRSGRPPADSASGRSHRDALTGMHDPRGDRLLQRPEAAVMRPVPVPSGSDGSTVILGLFAIDAAIAAEPVRRLDRRDDATSTSHFSCRWRSTLRDDVRDGRVLPDGAPDRPSSADLSTWRRRSRPRSRPR